MNIQPGQIGDLFSYKAEWLNERLYDLYREPEYFPEMTAESPCILIGGRGTGKTTVLRGLSYEGQYALNGSTRESVEAATFFGFYYKVNTNRTTAFNAKGLSDEEWVPYFSHYINLLFCEEVCKFLAWYRQHFPSLAELSAEILTELSASFQLTPIASTAALRSAVRVSLRQFEAGLNNLETLKSLKLSIQGGPIDILLEGLQACPEFKGRIFFFLLDEYENFLDYQQQVVNTLIKHCSPLYSFKIGVRELGWRRRTTLNDAEQLISPADYVRINIAEKLSGKIFSAFARDVCNARLEKLREMGLEIIDGVESAFPGLSEDDEADLLGVHERVAVMAGKTPFPFPSHLSQLEQYFLYTWAKSKNSSIEVVAGELLDSDGAWRDPFRFNNYKHSLLFSLKRGKPGIRKYYSGWDVLIRLAANNIRYLLELVDTSFSLHLRSGKSLSLPIDPQLQTKAAQSVGRKNLSELEGLTIYGAQLTKLLLSAGRIFQVMAGDPISHAPEVNQFHLEEGEEHSDAVEKLLRTAVMHLALVRSSGTKLADETDTREYDYSIHPIFAPFFVFSYRRKRKMMLRNHDLLGLVNAPQETIQLLLSRNNRTADEALPEQALLFEGFYGIAK